MKNVYDGILSFRGEWREYQARVLGEADRYLEDGRIHIVAAPGAGKTTLGIELIRRTGRPCLILSPRIVIRQQWLERTEQSFLIHGSGAGMPDGSFLSNDIRNPGTITSITYQTLFCGMTGKKETEEREDGSGREEIDLTDINLVKTVKESCIGTICLDECHHLKNEWWKALEDFMSRMGDVTVIALTATPPYDATPAQWERYTKLCGPIDAEITVPELVKEGSLCPHQDYVWFSYPSGEEEEEVLAFRRNAEEMFARLMEDGSLQTALSSHPALAGGEEYFDAMLEDPGYLSALLIFCQSRGIPFSWRWLELLGVKKMPEMSEKWMERLLQGFLYDDSSSYDCTEEYRDALIRQLRSRGLIEKKKVRFLVSDKIEKLLTNSRGKLDSILDIVSCESSSMGEGLRMLILTDHIRKEYMNAIGKEDRAVQSTGVIPVFELLRRRGTCRRLGVLCGSMLIIPDPAREAFTREIREGGNPEPIFRQLTNREGEPLGYSQVVQNGGMGPYMRAMTNLFEQGEVGVLIGTRSLLGEGWDSPCINSLILASSVGSYVLGNQMRGRAIRTWSRDPYKVSNIWHLVCLAPPGEQKEKRRMGIPEPELSEDYHTLERRMDGILCVSYDGTAIENGMQRLSTISGPFDRKSVRRINEDMARRSAHREVVAEQWKKAVCSGGKMEVTDEYRAGAKRMKPGFYFFHVLGAQIMITLGELCNILYRIKLPENAGEGRVIFFALTGLFLALSVLFGGKLLRQLTPMWRFQGVSRGVLMALREDGQIRSDCRVMTEETDGVTFAAWLQGGTDREKNVYADTIGEMLAPVENQRYLLCHGGKSDRAREYFCVPTVFAGSREKAERFRAALRPYIGNFRLVYTRNAAGRKILLHARAKAFSGRNERRMDRRKKVRGALE